MGQAESKSVLGPVRKLPNKGQEDLQTGTDIDGDQPLAPLPPGKPGTKGRYSQEYSMTGAQGGRPLSHDDSAMHKSSESLESRLSSAGISSGDFRQAAAQAAAEAPAGAAAAARRGPSKGGPAAARGSLGGEGSSGAGRPPLPNPPRTSRLSVSSPAHLQDGMHGQQPAASPTGAAAAAAGMAELSLSDGVVREELAPARSSAEATRTAGLSAISSKQQQGPVRMASHRGSARGSVDSHCSAASRGSQGGGGGAGSGGASSVRSSFAQEGPAGEELDAYGRPSLALFEMAHRKDEWQKGKVFEDSLPSDLQAAYRRLGVLLPQAPLPLSSMQQLWEAVNLTDTVEMVRIFVMQGVLKVATLADGQTWVLVSTQHQDYVKLAHRDQLELLHQHVLDVYSNHGQLSPAEFVNDGYILLALAHHLLGAGRLGQLRELLINPAWLEVKLHCYGVAALVEDFRKYLQEEQDPLVKLVLQAFQMSLGSCMERSNIPMLQRQLVLRLMAAAQTCPEVQACFEQHYNRIKQESAALSATVLAAATAAPPEATAAAEAAAAAGGGRPASPVAVPIQHLLARSPSLRQAGGQHRMVLRGHTGGVRKLVISPDGQDVLTASDDGSVHVWDMDIGDCIAQLTLPPPAPRAPLSALVSCDRDLGCLAGDVRGVLMVWDVQSSSCRQVLQGHEDRINAIAFHPTKGLVLTAGSDAKAKLWRMDANGKLQHMWTLGGHGSTGTRLSGHAAAIFDVSFSADGGLAATAADDFTVRVWDVEKQRCLHVLEGHEGWVTAVQFLGDSRHLVSSSHDTTARIWDGDSGNCLHVLQGHQGRLNNVRGSEDGSKVITCSDDGSAQVWDTATGRCSGVLIGHAAWVNDAMFTKDGSRAVTISADGTARVWDIATSSCQQVLEGHGDEVKTMALTNRSRFLVTGSLDSTARVWDLNAVVSGRDALGRGHYGKVTRVTGAGKVGSAAVSLGEDGTVRLWDTAAGRLKVVCVDEGGTGVPQWVRCTPDGGSCVAAAGNRRIMRWDMATGLAEVALPEQLGSRTKWVGYDRECKRAAVLLFDSSVSVWDLQTRECVCQLIKRGERDASRVHSGGVNAVYLADAGEVAVTVSKDCTARVWDLEQSCCTHVLQGHTDAINAAALSPDGTRLATASYDKTVRIWDLPTGACLRVLEHPEPIRTVIWGQASGSPAGGSYLVAIGDEPSTTAWLWCESTGSCIGVLAEHKDVIMDAAFSPDGRWVATVSSDSSLLLWEAASGQLWGVFMGDAAMTCCCWTEEGGALVAGDAGGQVHFLQREQACVRYAMLAHHVRRTQHLGRGR